MSASQGKRVTSGRGGTYLLAWTTYGTWLPGDAAGSSVAFRRRTGVP